MMMDLHEEAERLANLVERHITKGAPTHAAAETLRALSARLAEVERERDEALNQLDSERHSLEVLERRAAQFMAERDEARARVAAAFEEAAKIAFTAATSQASAQHRKTIAAAIRALARPEETDALDRIRAEERERCAKITERWIGCEAIAAAIRGDDT